VREAKEAALRLKNMLLTDKIKSPSSVENVIKSDVYYLLENYFETIRDTIDVRLSIDGDNLYDIKISLKAQKVKSMGIF
jgi:hypothetical protein